jgi:uncharacterized protein YukE
MDALDRLAPPAADLLARVDDTLVRCGAPPGHPVWPLLRRLRALPGEAVAALAVASPAPLDATGAVLRRFDEAYSHAYAALPAEVEGWRGVGAESFAAQWAALRAHLGEDLADRLRDTMSFVEAVERWVRDTRAALARTLAVVLTSAEAVAVRAAAVPTAPDASAASAVPSDEGPATGPVAPDVVRAAAGIAAHVLRTLVEAYDRGAALLDEWAPRLDEVRYRVPAQVSAAGFEATTEVTF